MRIRLGPDRRSMLLEAIVRFYRDEFDETLSEFRAAALLDFFVGELGPPVYNQGVRDAAGYVQGGCTSLWARLAPGDRYVGPSGNRWQKLHQATS